jgi:hypothetical protein
MIVFSIVLVSRSRHHKLRSLLESLQETCECKYEVFVGLDEDDPDLLKYYELLNSHEFPELKLHVANRIDNLHVRINYFTNFINGQYVFVLNDDCKLLTQGWDRLAKEKLGDGIVYGRTYDNSIDKVNREYSAFPIMSVSAVKKLDSIMDDRFGNHGADVVTYRIYNEANKVIDLPEVAIDHTFHNSIESLEDRMRDRTSVEMIQRTMSDTNFSLDRLFSCSVSKESKLLHE